MSLDKFVEDHDTSSFNSTSNQDAISSAYLFSNRNVSHLNVINSFTSLWAFHDHLESLDVLNNERLRPGWDSYFMVSSALLAPLGAAEYLHLLARLWHH